MKMKNKEKKLVFAVALLFGLTMVIPSLNAQLIGNSNDLNENVSNYSFTHTVLGELCTSTTCPYCPAASDQMHQVYNMGYDFIYVSLVGNKNSYALGRMNELGFGSYPSVAFDGGYQKIVGQQPNSDPYENAVQQCGSRSVADVDLSVKAYWMGGGEIYVSVDVTNNEGSSYNGHLHAYVTEIVSRWDDYSGDPYHFAMINNYAINQNVQVPSGSTKTISETWSGYSDITKSNIKVIASVFDQSTMYTDETAAADPEFPNTDPPSTPSQPSGPGSGYVGIEYTYSTSSTEPNGDSIKYGWDWDGDGTVDEWTDLHPSGEIVEISHSWSSTGTYNVKVKAKDQFGEESSFSPVKQVQITIGDPPNTPSAPSGETNGMHGTSYSYSTSTTDPNNGDKIYYKFDWGDGRDSGWVGPFCSGCTGSASHTWAAPGNYNIKVKAKDLAGSESSWSPETTVTMGNTPPNVPERPQGPMNGIIGKSYTYSTRATDPEGDSVEYLFDWGDGSVSGWIFYNYASHTWLEPGEYSVKVKARDWDESDWSYSLLVTIEGGSLSVKVEAEPTSAIVGEEIQFTATVSGGSEPYTYSWDFGDGNTSSKQNPTHVYGTIGEFTVNLFVQDSIGAFGSNYTTVNIELNHPPNIPTIDGPTEDLKSGQKYTYEFKATDPDGDQVYYYIDWGDGDTEEWIGSYESGEEVELSHKWDSGGKYSIRAKAKDIYDAESNWSQSLMVNIEWQQAFLLGIIKDREIEEETIKFTVVLLVYISSAPFKINFYSSGEEFIISKDSDGSIGNNFVFGRFKIGDISSK